jgi:Flp pilus assembly pilin Flp
MRRRISNQSRKWRRFASEHGQTLVEYGLIIALFCTVMIASLGLFQGGLSGYIENIVTQLAAAF